ncbi:hypothetical protein FKM82_013288 [Ascaphus truei]
MCVRCGVVGRRVCVVRMEYFVFLILSCVSVYCKLLHNGYLCVYCVGRIVCTLFGVDWFAGCEIICGSMHSGMWVEWFCMSDCGGWGKTSLCI